MIAAGALQLGAQQVQRQALLGREALVRQRRADLGDGGPQLAVRDQRARELLDDLDVVRGARARRARSSSRPPFTSARRPRRSDAAST